MTIIYALLMLCVLIFFHELGHFMAAKACGVKVNEFAIGMGPKVFKKQKGETLYSVRIFPIGGFCAMEGEDEESQDKKAFNNKKLWQKSIIIVAGAGMNLIIAIILMMFVNYYQGVPTTTINDVMANSPAKSAEIMVGDKIVEADGIAVDSWQKFMDIKNESEKDSIDVVIERNGERKSVNVPFVVGDNQKIIGITPASEKSLVTSIVKAPEKTFDMAKAMYIGLGKLIKGEVSTKDLSGPVGIVYLVKDSINTGGIVVVYLMALISLNLAIVNMLPLPALDGGRLVMAIIRRLTGKAISDRTEGIIHAVGMLALLGFTIYITYNDIVKFIVPIFK